jgi:Spy/CpxP family protein refolding chaperone
VKRAGGVAVLLLLVTFGVGAMAGMAIEEAAGIDWFDFLDRDEQEDVRLLDGMSLTPDQRAAVEHILDRQEDSLEKYWEARMPEIQGILAGSYDEIRALLAPAQRERFDQRVRDLEGRVPVEFRD